MEFFTTRYINELIKKDYFNFINKYYSDIFLEPNKYITLSEKKIAEYLGGGYVKLLNSGTTALQLGLLSLGIKEGDEVIIPANTYSATAVVITNIGAIPVFADINLDTFTLDVNDVEKKITPKTKGIIPVHLYGNNTEMNQLLKLAHRNNIKVLEDASHSFGGEYYGKKLGTLGDVGAFSCHLTKNFGTFGNGGIFYTKNKSIFDTLSSYIFPDVQNKEVLRSGRTPANMLAMDAIVLLIKLQYIDKVISSNLELYNQFLEKYDRKGFVFPKLDFKNHKLHIRNCVVLSDKREKDISQGMGKQYYDIDLSRAGIFSTNAELKNTKIFFEKNIALNFFYNMNLERNK